MLTRKTVLLAKVESSYGTDAAPDAAADAILISGLDIRPRGDVLERNFLRQTLTPLPFQRGMKWVELSFETELKGTGNAGQLPSVGFEGTLLQGCAMKETINAGTSIVYTPVSAPADMKSLTLYVYKDGIFHKVLGCRGTFAVSGTVGNYLRVRWTFQGLYVSPADTSPDSAAYSTLTPPVLLTNNQFLIQGYAGIVTAFDLAVNNRLALRRSVNAVTGVFEVSITGRSPQGSFDPEVVPEADHPFWGKWESAATGALSIGPIGDAGNQVKIEGTGLQYRDISYGDREGQLTYAIPFSLSGDGDDELTITFS